MYRSIASESTIHIIIAALSVVLLGLAIYIIVKKYKASSEHFQMEQIVPPSEGCKAAADQAGRQLCSFGASSIDIATRKQILETVLSSCPADFKLGGYLYQNFSNCPITATDLILGGTHNLAYRPVQLLPELKSADVYTHLTNWGLYQWKDEGKSAGTVTQL